MTQRAAIYIEMIPSGQALEIAAIDSATGREVRFIVPAATSEYDIKQLAAAKLAYVGRKASEKQLTENQTKTPPRNSRGGIIV